jgi:hypothetical protein
MSDLTTIPADHELTAPTTNTETVPGASSSLLPTPAPAAQDSTASTSPSPSSAEPAVPLSKSAQKKLAKQASFEAQKHERRAREKEKKKEKTAAAHAARLAAAADGGASTSQVGDVRAREGGRGGDWIDEERARKRKKVEGMKRFERAEKGEEDVKGDWFKARIVLDLGFDGLMVDKVRPFFSSSSSGKDAQV